MADLPAPIRCICKIGGAALTFKDELEVLNIEAVNFACDYISAVTNRNRRSILPSFEPSSRGSTRHASSRAPSSRPPTADSFDPPPPPSSSSRPRSRHVVELDDLYNAGEEEDIGPQNCIFVHGAGGFGHIQAKKFNLVHGPLVNQDDTRWGFADCRRSVTRLNHILVTCLVDRYVSAIGLSPVGSWQCDNGVIIQDGCDIVANAVRQGLVPLLHGDAVFDATRGCTILSGDAIMLQLAKRLKPQYAVFLTDVDGVYDRWPLRDTSKLISVIHVNKRTGKWQVVAPELNELDIARPPASSSDVTGGMRNKIEEAVGIVRMGIPVLIANATTEHGKVALALGPKAAESDEWVGTVLLPV